MKWVIIAIITIMCTLEVINKINQKKIINIFKSGNVCLSGLKGRGKDLLYCFVINKRKENYISNVNYSNPKKKYKKFDFDIKVWELAGNTYEDFAEGKTKKYKYPYPDGIDYYISDAGVYFPSQYHKELEKKYKSAPFFQALSRHLGVCNVHVNSQDQGRVWDKIREQSDQYLVANWSKVIFNKYFIEKVTLYGNEETAQKKIKKPFFGIGKTARQNKISWTATNGEVKSYIIASKIPYKYDSRRFKKILENGGKDYENDETV